MFLPLGRAHSSSGQTRTPDTRDRVGARHEPLCSRLRAQRDDPHRPAGICAHPARESCTRGASLTGSASTNGGECDRCSEDTDRDVWLFVFRTGRARCGSGRLSATAISRGRELIAGLNSAPRNRPGVRPVPGPVHDAHLDRMGRHGTRHGSPAEVRPTCRASRETSDRPFRTPDGRD